MATAGPQSTKKGKGNMKIGFFGAGKMVEGILSAIPDKKSVVMAERIPERAAELASKYGVATTGDVKEVAKKAKLKSTSFIK